MKVYLCFLLFLLLGATLHAQYTLASYSENVSSSSYTKPLTLESVPYRKLYQRNYGAIVGIQRGKTTSFEFGAEAHWRKLSLLNKPHIIGATANMEYSFGEHVMGYKAGMWMKRGRVNLTYGANLVYFTDFEGKSRYGIGPAVGFRLLGLHLVNGLNLLAGDKDLKEVNTLYLSLRYYFPIENKFTWDRKTIKKKERAKRQKAKAKEQKRKEREKRREENPSILDRIKKPFEKS